MTPEEYIRLLVRKYKLISKHADSKSYGLHEELYPRKMSVKRRKKKKTKKTEAI